MVERYGLGLVRWLKCIPLTPVHPRRGGVNKSRGTLSKTTHQYCSELYEISYLKRMAIIDLVTGSPHRHYYYRA